MEGRFRKPLKSSEKLWTLKPVQGDGGFYLEVGFLLRSPR
ncbi:hypothetical protein PAUR_a0998 [Pseudoalteromonas aurantia 208]|uniref:Uncharacterized protein n=1 Tax=Pseudoalteromonas aurantia 208 TaxID=1314867 RepID=A0ABR9EB63_9GAMM|nr:hypothetical protein [Pseudoalteromonas aurantia 208]